MAWDASATNRLLFTYGDIQCSPEEVVQLNSRALTLFKPTYEAVPTTSGYTVLLTGYSQSIMENSQKEGKELSLVKLLNQLRSMPRSVSTKQLKGTVDTLSIESEFYRVDYKVASGQVVVFNIQLIDTLQRVKDRAEKPALYKVKKRQGVWRVVGKVNKPDPGYAAVNGQSNNLAKAPWLMGAHLNFEFGKAVDEFTLFHNPSVGGFGDTWESLQDKLGLTTPVTKKFAHVLKQAHADSKEIKWVAHSQGAVIFSEAVRYILNHNSAFSLNRFSLNGATRGDKGGILSTQSVAMHGNANNNIRSKLLFSRAGVEVLAERSNSYDFVNTILGFNTLNPWRLLGSAVYSPHVFKGSVQQSPHTLMHRDWDEWNNKMKNGPGKGRNALQKGFHVIDSPARSTVRYIANHLK